MRINSFYANTVNFFREHKKRYGCIAVLEKMLLSKIDEEKLESLNNMSVPNKHTRHVSPYDIDILYVEEQYLEKQRIEREKEERRLRNRPPRRK